MNPSQLVFLSKTADSPKGGKMTMKKLKCLSRIFYLTVRNYFK